MLSYCPPFPQTIGRLHLWHSILLVKLEHGGWWRLVSLGLLAGGLHAPQQFGCARTALACSMASCAFHTAHGVDAEFFFYWWRSDGRSRISDRRGQQKCARCASCGAPFTKRTSSCSTSQQFHRTFFAAWTTSADATCQHAPYQTGSDSQLPSLRFLPAWSFFEHTAAALHDAATQSSNRASLSTETFQLSATCLDRYRTA